jgi:hypothetical protein
MVVIEAAPRVSAQRLSCWDALLWAAARLNHPGLDYPGATGSGSGQIGFLTLLAIAALREFNRIRRMHRRYQGLIDSPRCV